MPRLLVGARGPLGITERVPKRPGNDGFYCSVINYIRRIGPGSPGSNATTLALGVAEVPSPERTAGAACATHEPGACHYPIRDALCGCLGSARSGVSTWRPSLVLPGCAAARNVCRRVTCMPKPDTSSPQREPEASSASKLRCRSDSDASGHRSEVVYCAPCFGSGSRTAASGAAVTVLAFSDRLVATQVMSAGLADATFAAALGLP